jgi:preprotein translocase subunit SecF
MKIVRFSKLFIPTAVFSIILIVIGIAGFFVKGGFNLGVDFQAGLIQEVQFAPQAFSITWTGRGNAAISFDRGNLYIVISGAGIDNVTHDFSFTEYPTLGALGAALDAQEGLGVVIFAPLNAAASLLIQSTQGNPQLGQEPYVVHYLPEGSEEIPIEDVRAALTPLGTVSVQVLGLNSERRFMIRMEDSELAGANSVPAD